MERGSRSSLRTLSVTLEVDLYVLVELLEVVRYALVEDRVGPVAVGSGEVETDQIVDLLACVHLVVVQCGFQVLQLVRVGLLGEDRGAVLGSERLLNGKR